MPYCIAVNFEQKFSLIIFVPFWEKSLLFDVRPVSYLHCANLYKGIRLMAHISARLLEKAYLKYIAMCLVGWKVWYSSNFISKIPLEPTQLYRKYFILRKLLLSRTYIHSRAYEMCTFIKLTILHDFHNHVIPCSIVWPLLKWSLPKLSLKI